MAATAFNFGGKLKKIVLTQRVSHVGNNRWTHTFNVASALPDKYKALNVSNLHAGLDKITGATGYTVGLNSESFNYDANQGIASVVVTFNGGSSSTFSATIELAIVYA